MTLLYFRDNPKLGDGNKDEVVDSTVIAYFRDNPKLGDGNFCIQLKWSHLDN